MVTCGFAYHPPSPNGLPLTLFHLYVFVVPLTSHFWATAVKGGNCICGAWGRLALADFIAILGRHIIIQYSFLSRLK